MRTILFMGVRLAAPKGLRRRRRRKHLPKRQVTRMVERLRSE